MRLSEPHLRLHANIGFVNGSSISGFVGGAEVGDVNRNIFATGDGSLQLTVKAFSHLRYLNNEGLAVEGCIHGMEESYNGVPNWKHAQLLDGFAVGVEVKGCQVRTARKWDVLLAEKGFLDPTHPCPLLVEIFLTTHDEQAAMKDVEKLIDTSNARKGVSGVLQTWWSGGGNAVGKDGFLWVEYAESSNLSRNLKTLSAQTDPQYSVPEIHPFSLSCHTGSYRYKVRLCTPSKKTCAPSLFCVTTIMDPALKSEYPQYTPTALVPNKSTTPPSLNRDIRMLQIRSRVFGSNNPPVWKVMNPHLGGIPLYQLPPDSEPGHLVKICPFAQELMERLLGRGGVSEGW